MKRSKNLRTPSGLRATIKRWLVAGGTFGALAGQTGLNRDTIALFVSGKREHLPPEMYNKLYFFLEADSNWSTNNASLEERRQAAKDARRAHVEACLKAERKRYNLPRRARSIDDMIL